MIWFDQGTFGSGKRNPALSGRIAGFFYWGKLTFLLFLSNLKIIDKEIN